MSKPTKMKHSTSLSQVFLALAVSLIVAACSSDNTIIYSVNIDQENLTDKTDKSYDQDHSGDVDSITDTYRYQLPVIFHIFCMEGSNTKSILTPKRINFILNNVNALWKGSYNSSSKDIGVNFVLATDVAETDKSGNTVYVRLKNPGIDYINWTGDSIDVEEFMNSKNNGTYMEHLWDPNHYINIMVFPYKNTTTDGSTILGISDLPYTTDDSYKLDGLIAPQTVPRDKSNLNFVYCSSINAIFADSKYDSERYTTVNGINSSMVDISATLAHELGHYLGLHHVFTEDADGNILDSCGDTDYCEDTPSYDKKEYDNWLSYYFQTHQKYYIEEADVRNNCSGQTFHASNFMDYAVCTSDFFSEDQRDRMRHVLYYSPLIPGPKKTVSSRAAQTRAAENQPLDLPVMIRK
nr:zinc-dependent metalloproteinase lipoprotein [Prevotella sp. UBA5379]